MNTVAQSTLFSEVGEFLRRRRWDVTFFLLAMLSGALLLWRVIFYGDSFGFWVFGFYVGMWVVTALVFWDDHRGEGDLTERGKLLWIRVPEFVSICMLLSLFLIWPDDDGVWVRTDGSETSLSKSWFFVRPFEPLYYVDNEFDLEEALVAEFEGGIPVECTVATEGIRLDYRNPAVLEHQLLEVAKVQDPSLYMYGLLGFLVEKSARTALQNRAADDLFTQGERRLVIPYQIGASVGDGLASLGLRWEEGSVDYWCSLEKFNT